MRLLQHGLQLVVLAVAATFTGVAAANQFLLLTDSAGTISKLEIMDSPDCPAIFFTGQGWTGQRLEDDGFHVDNSSVINMSEVSVIRRDESKSFGFFVETNNRRVLPAPDLYVEIFYPKIDESQTVICPKKEKVGKWGSRYTGNKLAIGQKVRNVSFDRVDVFGDLGQLETAMADRLEKQAKARNEAAEQEARARKEAAEWSVREKKAAAVRDAEAKSFRKSLSIGKDTHCGMIIDKNGPIVKVQTIAGEKWLKVEQIYPPGSHGCRFYNGQYVD